MKNLSSKWIPITAAAESTSASCVEQIEPIDQRRVFPLVDRYLLGFLALQLVAFPLVPALPLVIAAAALATPLRSSPGRMTALWAIGAVLTLIVLAPLIIDLFDFQIVDEGPVHTIAP